MPLKFPQALLPQDSGLFIVDPYGGALVREAPVHKLSAARRKALLITFGAVASRRLLATETGLIEMA